MAVEFIQGNPIMPVVKELDKVSVKVTKQMKRELETKFPRHGEISKFIRALVKLYFAGKISKAEVENATDFL